MKLELRGVSAWYGAAQALWDVEVGVREGEVVGILGRNGAGKTTLLRAIAGLQSRVAGDVLFDGQPFQSLPAHVRAQRGISIVREGAKLPGSMTVRENLELGARLGRLRGRAPRALKEVLDLFPIIAPFLDRKAALLSGGQRQGLALAVAFASSPELLLLDEPSAGLAPKVAHELFATLKTLSSMGNTILVVEQHPVWLLDFANRGYLLEIGRVVNAGETQDLLASRAMA